MKQYLGVFLRGMAMGAADIVPGVSGGTIALITGIYQELLDSLKSITPAKLPMIWKDGPLAFWQTINGNFLISLMAGIVASLISLSHLISYLLESFPILVWAFFFGLVAASGFWLMKQANFKCPISLTALLLGTLVAWLITSGKPMQLEVDNITLFFSGALAICAMILPGISGSFILLLLGVYPTVLAAIKGFDIQALLFFAAGCALGLLSFVHLLSFLLKRYHSIAMALLTGFLFGSLNALWPWKKVLETYTSSSGTQKPLLQANISPAEFAQINQIDSQWLLALIIAITGAIVVIALEKLSKKNEDATAKGSGA